MKIYASIFVLTTFLIAGCNLNPKNIAVSNQSTKWILADILSAESDNIAIHGNPISVDSPYGNAVYFDGVDDALFLDEMPLKNEESFTIEMVFNPSEVDAPFEQRIVHIGEVSGDRMLLEIRAVEGNWYFDGFVASQANNKALIDEKLIHPLGKWYHVALVVTPNSMTTYVNGQKELQEAFTYQPINSGRSSIGVRLNKRSWYKGSIYMVKISPGAVAPSRFISI